MQLSLWLQWKVRIVLCFHNQLILTCCSYPLLAKVCLSALYLLSKPRWVIEWGCATFILNCSLLKIAAEVVGKRRQVTVLLPSLFLCLLALWYSDRVFVCFTVTEGFFSSWLAIQNHEHIEEVYLENSCGPLWSCCQNSFFFCHFTSMVVDYLSE